ncbi:MAG: hypothetical protein ABIS47_12530, partial [Acidimicrobiales bacterium]
MTDHAAPPGATAVDPVLVQRERMRRLASLGSRIGYLAMLVAIVGFLVGALSDLPQWSVTVVVAGLAVSTAFLVPSIILGYAVKAAAGAAPSCCDPLTPGAPTSLLARRRWARSGRYQASPRWRSSRAAAFTAEPRMMDGTRKAVDTARPATTTVTDH